MTDNKSSEAKGQSVDTTSPPPNGPEQPSFFDDLATSMLTPGYIGHYTLKIVTYSIIAYSLVVIYRAIADPVFLNLISLISLIPALGLIITLRWFLSELAATKNQTNEASVNSLTGTTKPKED